MKVKLNTSTKKMKMKMTVATSIKFKMRVKRNIKLGKTISRYHNSSLEKGNEKEHKTKPNDITVTQQ